MYYLKIIDDYDYEAIAVALFEREEDIKKVLSEIKDIEHNDEYSEEIALETIEKYAIKVVDLSSAWSITI